MLFYKAGDSFLERDSQQSSAVCELDAVLPMLYVNLICVSLYNFKSGRIGGTSLATVRPNSPFCKLHRALTSHYNSVQVKLAYSCVPEFKFCMQSAWVNLKVVDECVIRRIFDSQVKFKVFCLYLCVLLRPAMGAFYRKYSFMFIGIYFIADGSVFTPHRNRCLLKRFYVKVVFFTPPPSLQYKGYRLLAKNLMRYPFFCSTILHGFFEDLVLHGLLPEQTLEISDLLDGSSQL